MGTVHRSVPLMLSSTRIHIYIVFHLFPSTIVYIYIYNGTWVNGVNFVLLDYLEYEKGHSVDST